jgi:hypothetical protein
MAYENLRREIERLSQIAPDTIILTLADGTKFYYDGDALSFAMDAMRKGPVARACAKTVSATGCGRLYELGAAFTAGPVKNVSEYVSKAPAEL